MDEGIEGSIGSSYLGRKRKIYKIIVIGDSNVGKTCLTFRFCGGKFPESTEATIGVDFRERKLTLDSQEIILQLWDTAGQERFRRSMIQHYYRNVDAVVFVYDITNISSFDALSIWIDECNRHNLSYNIPRVLVGNKCDCMDSLAVPTNMAQKFADQHSMPLFETSAKNDSDSDHVESIFLTIAHKLKACKPMMPINPSQTLPENMERTVDVHITRESVQTSEWMETLYCC